MWRLFGQKKEEAPPPSLQEVSDTVDGRVAALDTKIHRMELDLAKLKDQIGKSNSPSQKHALRHRAMQILKQKRTLEGQRDQLSAQSFNIGQTAFVTEQMAATATTVSAMKAASATLKTQVKELNVDEVEDLHMELEDLLEQNDEIQGILSREFGVPEGIQEEDLDAELELLSEDLLVEEEATPSYLAAPALAAPPTTEPALPPAPAPRQHAPPVGRV